MFGLYELQLPSALRDRLSSSGDRMRGGQYAGVFAMGGISALVVSPCVPRRWPPRCCTSARPVTPCWAALRSSCSRWA
jgi:hypothetical protein